MFPLTWLYFFALFLQFKVFIVLYVFCISYTIGWDECLHIFFPNFSNILITKICLNVRSLVVIRWKFSEGKSFTCLLSCHFGISMFYRSSFFHRLSCLVYYNFALIYFFVSAFLLLRLSDKCDVRNLAAGAWLSLVQQNFVQQYSLRYFNTLLLSSVNLTRESQKENYFNVYHSWNSCWLVTSVYEYMYYQ